MKARHARLLQMLKESEGGFIGGRIIAERLGVSLRTIRNDVRYLNESYLIDTEISSSTRLGYKLEGEMRTFKKQSYLDFPERAFSIMRILMDHDDWLSYEDIAKELLVSSQTISSDVLRIAETIGRQNLHATIKTVPFSGIRLVGKEIDKRMLLVSFLKKVYSSREELQQDLTFHLEAWFEKSTVNATATRLDKTLSDLKLKLDLNKWSYLFTHILIQLHRSNNHALPEHELDMEETNFVEEKIAKVILDVIFQAVGRTCPETEKIFLTLQMLGLKVVQEQEDELHAHTKNSFILKLEEALERLGEKYGYRLTGDRQLVRGLQIHLEKVVYPLKHHVKIENPLLTQIKEEYIQAYQMAVVLAEFLGKKLSVLIPETEVGYIALHIEAAIERFNDKPILVALVSTKSHVTTMLMKQKIERRFRQVQIVDTFSLHTMNDIPKDVTLIISTAPVQCEQKMVVVNEFLRSEDLELIKQKLTFGILRKRVSSKHFFKFDERTKNALLEVMAKKAGCERYLTSILDRESLSSTDIGSKMAVPHPLISAKESHSSIFVGVNQQAVQWGQRSVQVVFLLILSEKDTIYYESIFREIYQLMRSDTRISRLTQNKTYEVFMELLDDK